MQVSRGKIRVLLSPPGEKSAGTDPFPPQPEEQAVVVDILRASTSIIQALAAGAMTVVPCTTPEEAKERAGLLDPAKVLLAGEKGGLKPPGFDFGNSPGEFIPTRVRGKSLIMGTTNGTRAILCSVVAKRVLVGGFVNLSVLVEELLQQDNPVVVVCAGQHGIPCEEDSLFAGWLGHKLVEADASFGLANDPDSRKAWDLAAIREPLVLPEMLRGTKHGENLVRLGFERDVDLAGAVDSIPVVPQLRYSPYRLELIGPVG